MAEKGIDYRVEYGNFVLFGHDCGFGCRQTNNAPDDRTFQVSVVTCRRAPLHGGIPVDTRGSASRMARLSPLGARFAPCGGAGWKLGFQFYRKKFTPARLAVSDLFYGRTMLGTRVGQSKGNREGNNLTALYTT